MDSNHKACVLFLFGVSFIILLSIKNPIRSVIQFTVSNEAEAAGNLFLVDKFLYELKNHGTLACHGVNTSSAQLLGLPSPKSGKSLISLTTGVPHKFLLVAYDVNGTRRCHGGDFFETSLAGNQWKSRPQTTDLGDGSYEVEFYVDAAFPGLYTFNATLFYSNFHSMNQNTPHWVVNKEVLNFKLEFISSISKQKQKHNRDQYRSCMKDDFKLHKWKGMWTRTKSSKTCTRVDPRYHCLEDSEMCDLPWCDGALGKLDSNGWIYSAHCSFHLWTANEAWECLNGKRLFFWGDSNHQDTIRNLFNLVLNLNHGKIGRFFNETLVDKEDPSRSFQLMQFFNGHHNIQNDGLGLAAMTNVEYKERLERLFQGGEFDTVVMNTGLHDGIGFETVWEFIEAVKNASRLWGELRKSMRQPNRMIFRTTVAVAGSARHTVTNPHKMEVYNQILVDELVKEIEGIRIVDAFDMTFPWHYDHTCSDGGHYGRPPPNFYFVDLMLVHALLNAICSKN